MCGRYAMAQSQEEIVAFFNLVENDSNPTLPLNWNVAPTNEIYIVKDRDRESHQRVLDTASWGLIAPWQKNFADARAGQSHAINARSESIHEKPTFRDAFRTSRCLIPVTGYYEWATSLGRYSPKQPFYITSDNGSPLSVAGIWSSWKSESGVEIQSASIITREAVGELATIHSRMPVFMARDRWEEWLDPNNREIAYLQALMASEDPAAGLITRPVSPRVNLVANNGPGIIEEIELGEPETLF
jgi:putative SOS response-associated peptidase YedK